MNSTAQGSGGKLLIVFAAGMGLVASAGGYGLWQAWRGLQAAQAPTDGIVVAAVLMLIVAAIALVALHFFMRRLLGDPADRLLAGLEQLAAGDYARPLPAGGGDALGRCSARAEALRLELVRTLGGIQGSARQVSAEAGRLVQSSAAAGRGSCEQSNSAATVLADIGRVAAGIRTIFVDAEALRQQAGASLAQAHTGNEKLSELVGQVDVAESAIKEIEDAVAEFLQSTRVIITMTQQVRDIADQTNLLALNAAIEAARAGEQGRGFAVVADEVRKLAEKSAQSASQIDEVTRALSKKSESVDQAIQQGRGSLHASQESVETVAIVLAESNGMLAQVTGGVDAIALAVKEQDRAADTIARLVETVARQAEAGCKDFGDTARAVEELRAAAAQMEQSLQGVRV